MSRHDALYFGELKMSILQFFPRMIVKIGKRLIKRIIYILTKEKL